MPSPDLANYPRIAEAGPVARLLARLMREGLDPDALPAAGALVVVLDVDALEQAEDRRRRPVHAHRVRQCAA